MNIQRYYKKTADISLNGSLAALVPPSFFLLYAVIADPRVNLFLFVTPFLIYSFICYQIYLLNNQRAGEIEADQFSKNKRQTMPLLSQNNVLIAFMPAPSLRMLIFDAEGRRTGEIRDIYFWKIRWFIPYFLDRLLTKKIGVYNENGRLESTFIHKNTSIDIMDGNGSVQASLIFKKDGSKRIYTYNGECYTIYRTYLHTDIQVYKNNSNRIARFRKGWMPLDWGKRFRDPNTPVLSFEAGLTDGEKLMIYAIFASLFHYRNH